MNFDFYSCFSDESIHPLSSSAQSDSPLYDTATFAQIVVTKEGNTLTFYKDGAQVGATKSNSETYGSGAPTQTLFGLRGDNNNESFEGQFCIIRVYDTALSSADVLENYNAEPLSFGPDKGTLFIFR